jgi:hypothetical protein
MPCNKRHPGESRGPVYFRASGASWVPAFAGMTQNSLPLQHTPYLPLAGRSGVALATLGWGLQWRIPQSAPPHPARSRERATLPIKGRDGARGIANW